MTAIRNVGPSPFQAVGDYSVESSAPARAVFSADYQNPKIHAAGILPYAFDGHRTVVLLSQHDSSDEKHPENTDVWEGFGGFQESGHTLVETAFEELEEESRKLFHLTYDTVDKHGMVAFVQQNRYFQLMARIEYDPVLPAIFRNTFVQHDDTVARTEELGSGVRKIYVTENINPKPGSVYNSCMEKLALRWIPLKDLVHDLKYTKCSVVIDKNGKETCIPRCSVWDRENEEDLRLRPAFIATMSSFVDAAPDVVAQVIHQTITKHDSSVMVTSRQ
jgi:hypothetical protein